MEILYVADGNSIHSYRYLDKVLTNDNVVDLVSFYYKKSGIKDISDVNKYYIKPYKTIVGRIINGYLLVREMLACKKKYDCMQVDYISIINLLFVKRLLILTPKLILTFYGSDLFRTKKVFSIWIRVFLNKAYKINLLSQGMLDYFHSVYGYKYDEKINLCDFGNSLIEPIDDVQLSMGKIACKNYLGCESDSLLISIGYNAIKEQQHLKLIKALNSLDVADKNKKLTLVLHLYGKRNRAYINKIVRTIVNSGLKYIIIDRYLDDREMAILRVASDIFLYGQTTDALASSVIEYLYAGCVWIAPQWLDYRELEENGVSYIRYSSFKELPGAISKAMNVAISSEWEKNANNNKMVLFDMYSWRVVASKWNEIYK